MTGYGMVTADYMEIGRFTVKEAISILRIIKKDEEGRRWLKPW